MKCPSVIYYCGFCKHYDKCESSPEYIGQIDDKGYMDIVCQKFERIDENERTHSENAPENGDSEKRVNENEAKNIDSFENKEVSRRDKIARVQAYCNSMTCSACVINEICDEDCKKHNDKGWLNSTSEYINAAYELIKDKQPAETPAPTPGMATAAKHYQLLTQQPIEIMQRLMTHEQFVGFLWGNCIKYALRLGHKDDTKSDAGKLAQYARWLMQVENGETIRP